MSHKKKNNNLQQALIFIIFVLIVGLFGYFNDNIDYNDNTSNSTVISTDIENIPEYSGNPYVKINNNIPFFTENDYTTEAF